MENVLFHRNSEDNSSDYAEIIALLELATMLEKKGQHISKGNMKIGFNRKKGHKKIVKSMLKYNEHAKEAGREIAMTKKLLCKIKFNVTL